MEPRPRRLLIGVAATLAASAAVAAVLISTGSSGEVAGTPVGAPDPRLVLLASPEEEWVPGLVERLRRERDPATARTLVRSLAAAVTPEADAAVRAVAADPHADASVRACAASEAARAAAVPPPGGAAASLRADFDFFLAACEREGRVVQDARLEVLRRDALHHVRRADEPRLREIRRKIAHRGGPEADPQVEYVTLLLRRALAAAR